MKNGKRILALLLAFALLLTVTACDSRAKKAEQPEETPAAEHVTEGAPAADAAPETTAEEPASEEPASEEPASAVCGLRGKHGGNDPRYICCARRYHGEKQRVELGGTGTVCRSQNKGSGEALELIRKGNRYAA